jgi:hypothetical protein
MVAIDQFLEELCPLNELSVFRTFFSLLIDIILIFGTLLCHTKIQIKFEFGFDPLIFPEVMAHELKKISRIISFPDFFLAAYRYSFDIRYIVLPYQDTDQVRDWF